MPRKRKLWTNEDLENAMNYSKAGASLRDAGRKYGIPRATLACRLKNKPLKKPGPDPKMSPEDEVQLVSYIEFMANMGSPVSTRWVKQTAARLIKHRCVSFEVFY